MASGAPTSVPRFLMPPVQEIRSPSPNSPPLPLPTGPRGGAQGMRQVSASPTANAGRRACALTGCGSSWLLYFPSDAMWLLLLLRGSCHRGGASGGQGFVRGVALDRDSLALMQTCCPS